MDTEYILGCAYELGETTALENSVLSHLKGAYPLIREAVDQNLDFPKDFLANTARRTFREVGSLDRHLFSLLSLPAIDFGLQALQGRAEHLVQGTLQRQLGLDDSRWPAFYSEMDAARPNYVQREEDISEGVVRQVLSDLFAPVVRRWEEDYGALRDACDWLADNGCEGLVQLELMPVGARNPRWLSAQDALASLQAQRKRRAQQEAKAQLKLQDRAKSAIKKATKLFENLGQRNNLSLFVSGAEVTLSHPDSMFKFVLKPLADQGWLVDRTMQGRSHTPYELMLLTKDNVHLARLCVYFENTPVLDQLLALTLFVQAGDEMKILQTANWFAHGRWPDDVRQAVLQQHPQLQSKLPRERDEEQSRNRVVVPERFTRLQRHWEPYAGRVQQWVRTWFEPITAPALTFQPEVELLSGTVRELELLRHQALTTQDARQLIAA